MLFPVLVLAALVGGALALGATPVRAEQPPAKRYTTADGLPHDHVYAVLHDSHGFLWFGTSAGLARFDGHSFTTFTERDGLPAPAVHHVIEAGEGEYWLATSNGVCRFVAADSHCEPQSLGDRLDNRVFVLMKDKAGRLWAGAAGGLFTLEPASGRFVIVPLGQDGNPGVRALAQDSSGGLWLGTGRGLFQRLADGTIREHTLTADAAMNGVTALAFDDDGRLWMAHRTGLIVVMPSAAGAAAIRDVGPAAPIDLPAKPGTAVRFRTIAGMSGREVQALYRAPGGAIWIATNAGIFQFASGRLQRTAAPEGLTAASVISLATDRLGHVWAGTVTDGVIRMARHALVSHGDAGGLPRDGILSIFEDRSGALVVLDGSGVLHRLDRGRFTSVRPNLPERYVANVTSSGPLALQDRTGDWWFRSPDVLFRFSVRRFEDLATAAPAARYTRRDGLAYGRLSKMRIYEDRRGDIWVGTMSESGPRLTRWDRQTAAFRSSELPQRARSVPSVFIEDREGHLYVALAQRGLLRCGRARCVRIDLSALPAAPVMQMYVDPSGRLWLAAERAGLVRIDSPASRRPVITRYGAAQGLTGSIVTSVTGDSYGRIYAGADRGVDRLDPATGRVRRYTTADGLAQNEQRTAFRDRHGTLWFGSVRGLSSLVPEPDAPALPPPVHISGLRIAGAAQPVSALGAASLGPLELQPSTRQMEIDFGGIGDMLRFQYRLDGFDADWSPVRAERTVAYSSLEPGAYRFLVRAISADGLASEQPASVAFTVLAPIWRRWWFIAGSGAALCLALAGLHRYRVRHLLELERVRTRIASDLHDDIGSSLSQIAILGEVVRARIGSGEPALDEPLSRIGNLSRECIDSMSDIVWAIDPHKDRVQNLAQRMRRLASDVLPASGIDFSFEAVDDRLTLGADVRREVFLAFKEALNNVVRHSACTRVDIALRLEGPWLVMVVADDGRGFDTQQEAQGNGLRSLKRRAAALGGSVQVASAAGTRVTLRIPWRRARAAAKMDGHPPDQVSAGAPPPE